MFDLHILCARSYSRRGLVLLATAIMILLAFPFNRSLLYTSLVVGHYPPLYPQYHRLERQLPHYQQYEHSDVKYLWSPNHPARVGWGNIMQDYILNYVLAYATNRSFVFDDYTWAIDDTPYSHFNGKLISSRIPLNALIDGPLAGGALPSDESTPRAVYKDFFHRVCPNPTILQLSDVTGWTDSDTVRFVFDKWIEKIASIEDPCLQFEETSPDKQIFDVTVFAKKERLLSMWPYMSSLPVLSHWKWSPLVHDAFEANQELIYPSALRWPNRHESNVPETMAGLLAIHVRRGDFAAHCKFLARWNADWEAFNSFLELPDKYDKVGSDPRLSTENYRAYMDHCTPDIKQIVEKVKVVLEESTELLEYVYIMTNGDVAWVEDLKLALSNLKAWKHIGSSRDLNLTWEQKPVAHALDMLVGQKAQVFIGNGWSSLSSNIVMLRMVDGLPPETNRLW